MTFIGCNSNLGMQKNYASATWDIFDFSSETPERNSTKHNGQQDLNVLYQVCVFGPISMQKWQPWQIHKYTWAP